jgi:hypothetical protein
MSTGKQTVAVIILSLWATAALGEVIDKIVTVVNDKFIITLSDIRKERAIQGVLGTTDLGNDDEVASAIVEKHLVEEQIAVYPPIMITEERIQEQLQAIKDPRGFSPQELREAVISKLRRSDFTVQRFGPFVEVSDEEVRKYYDEKYVPERRSEGLPVPSLEQARDTIRPLLLVLKINDELDTWMGELLRRTKVEKVSK